MGDTRIRDVYEIINEFDRHFGQKNIGIKISSVSDAHIYIQIMYERDAEIAQEDAWPGQPCPIEFGNSGRNLYAMMKLWVRDQSEYYDAYSGGRIGRIGNPKGDLYFWNDGIYCNDYTMPSYAMAKRLWAAKKARCGCLAEEIAGGEVVKISGKLLKQARKEACENLEKLSEDLLDIAKNYRNGKQKTSSIRFGSRSIREIFSMAGQCMDDAARTADYLMFGINEHTEDEMDEIRKSNDQKLMKALMADIERGKI